MGKKVDNATKFFVALENPEEWIEYSGFKFLVKAPTLAEEAKISLQAMKVMRELFNEDDLKDFVNLEEDNILDTFVGQNAVFNSLPQHVIIFLESVAYLNLVVKDIKTSDDKTIVFVDKDGQEKEVHSFMDFVKLSSVLTKGQSVFQFVDGLLIQVKSWLRNQELKPSEVKN